MSALCVVGIKGLVYQIAKLDTCGAPVTGAGSLVIGKFVKTEAGFEYEDGTEFLLKNADGSACVNEKDDPFLKRVTPNVDLCGIDPDGAVIITGETLITTGAPATGTGVAYGENPNTARFSLEIWQKVAGECPTAGQQYLYWAFFNLGAAKVKNYTFELAPSQFGFSSESRKGSASWNAPAALGTGLPSGFSASGKHYAHNVTTVAPPTPACGASALA